MITRNCPRRPVNFSKPMDIPSAARVQNGNGNGSMSFSAPSLAMVYSPKQEFRNLYTPAQALSAGTLFSELNKPFCPDRRCL